MRRALPPLLTLALFACTDDGALEDADATDTGETDETDGDGDGDGEPEALSTCGSGGATGQWTRYDVALSWYEVLAPELDGPLPLVVALHGDEGNPGAGQWTWQPVVQSATPPRLVFPPRAVSPKLVVRPVQLRFGS